MATIYGSNSILPNGTTINGVCNINQTSRPTTRPDGTALVTGDIWYNTSSQVMGRWNGTYWLGNINYVASTPAALTATNGALGAISVPVNVFSFTDLLELAASSTIFFHKIGAFVRMLTLNYDGSNYYTLQVRERNINSSLVANIGSLYTLNTNLANNTNTYYLSLVSNTANSFASINELVVSATKVGTPSNLNFQLVALYSYIL
jgi:hypothetical protein